MSISRLEKVGTIFARMNSLLRKRVLHVDDKPIWFDVYALHPPYNEPRYDQKAPEGDVREIFYEEDLIRAKFHEQVKSYEIVNMNDQKKETRTKKFINLYTNLKQQGALDDEKVFEVALEQFRATDKQRKERLVDEISDEPIKIASETEATDMQVEQVDERENPELKKKTDAIDIKSLF